MTESKDYERFGRYYLLHRIAIGGMAEIFLSHPGELRDEHQLLVIKRIREDLCMDDDFVEMFIDEARVVSRLDHPNIIKMLEFGHVEGRYFIALEHVWGESLRTLTLLSTKQKKRFPLGAALYVGAETAAALKHAHAQYDERGELSPVIHRDVTLGNVVVSYAGDVKVLDYGIAKAKGRISETRAGQIKGTLSYLAPEQLRGADCGPFTDIYQLGVLLYQTLVGRLPVTADSEGALMAAIVAGKITRPSDAVPGFPRHIERLLLKAMARNPQDRFRSAAELEGELRQLLRGTAFAEGRARIGQFVCEVTGDRRTKQEKFIQDLIDGIAVEPEEATDLFKWAGSEDAPNTLEVELSCVMDQSQLQDFEDSPTIVMPGGSDLGNLAAAAIAAERSVRHIDEGPSYSDEGDATTVAPSVYVDHNQLGPRGARPGQARVDPFERDKATQIAGPPPAMQPRDNNATIMDFGSRDSGGHDFFDDEDTTYEMQRPPIAEHPQLGKREDTQSRLAATFDDDFPTDQGATIDAGYRGFIGGGTGAPGSSYNGRSPSSGNRQVVRKTRDEVDNLFSDLGSKPSLDALPEVATEDNATIGVGSNVGQRESSAVMGVLLDEPTTDVRRPAADLLGLDEPDPMRVSPANIGPEITNTDPLGPAPGQIGFTTLDDMVGPEDGPTSIDSGHNTQTGIAALFDEDSETRPGADIVAQVAAVMAEGEPAPSQQPSAAIIAPPPPPSAPPLLPLDDPTDESLMAEDLFADVSGIQEIRARDLDPKRSQEEVLALAAGAQGAVARKAAGAPGKATFEPHGTLDAKTARRRKPSLAVVLVALAIVLTLGFFVITFIALPDLGDALIVWSKQNIAAITGAGEADSPEVPIAADPVANDPTGDPDQATEAAAIDPDATGTLTFTSKAPLTVYVDGKRVGRTPLSKLELPAGSHELRYKKSRKAPATKITITIYPDQDLHITD